LPPRWSRQSPISSHHAPFSPCLSSYFFFFIAAVTRAPPVPGGGVNRKLKLHSFDQKTAAGAAVEHRIRKSGALRAKSASENARRCDCLGRAPLSDAAIALKFRPTAARSGSPRAEHAGLPAPRRAFGCRRLSADRPAPMSVRAGCFPATFIMPGRIAACHPDTGHSVLVGSSAAHHPTQPFAAAPMNDRFGKTVPLV
jgi:hypothetical protein